MKEYICKIAAIDEMEVKWYYEIKKHKNCNWKIWKNEAISRVKSGQSIVYYGVLNGEIICETTAMLDKSIVQNGKTWLVIKQCIFVLFVLLKSIRVKVIFQSYLIL